MANTSAASFVKNAISQGVQAYGLSLEDVAFLRAFPVRRVNKRTGTYYTFDRDDLQRLPHDGRRVPGGLAKFSNMGFTAGTFTCEDIAANIAVDADEVNDWAGTMNAQQFYSGQAASMVLRIAEDRWATDYFATSKWTATGSDAVPSTKWDSADGGDPRGDIRKGVKALTTILGHEPQSLLGVCGPEVWQTLEAHPAFTDWAGVVNAQGVGLTGREQVARALGLRDIVVSYANKVTSLEGATDVTAAVLGKHFLVLNANPAPFDLADPTAACTFVSSPLSVRTWQQPGTKPGSFVAEASIQLAFKQVAAPLGYLCATVLT
jgi:hypothetical protein